MNEMSNIQIRPQRRVAFDTRWIYENPSGIGIYTEAIAARIAALRQDVNFVFLFNSNHLADSVMRKTGLINLQNVECKILPYGPLSIKNQFLLPKELRALNVDLYHGTNYMIPYGAFFGRASKIKCIATMHDVIPLVINDYAPNSRTSRMKKIYKFCLKQSVLRADAVVTVSESSKRDIVGVLSLNSKHAERIHVIYNGASSCFTDVGKTDVKRDSQSLRRLLYVGRMDMYKNVAGLVESFANASKKVPFPMRLIIAGANDSRYPEASAMVKKLGVENVVEITGFIDQEKLFDLYRTSDLLVHPSRYEGFGLQIVEAMKSGLPVCCTDGGSQPEIAGDAAFIVHAGNNEEMCNAIVALLSDPKKLESMRCAGIKRASNFDWDIAAEKISALYDGCFENNEK